MVGSKYPYIYTKFDIYRPRPAWIAGADDSESNSAWMEQAACIIQ